MGIVIDNSQFCFDHLPLITMSYSVVPPSLSLSWKVSNQVKMERVPKKMGHTWNSGQAHTAFRVAEYVGKDSVCFVVCCCCCLVTKSCETLCGPMDYNPPGSSVCGIFQGRIVEWIAILFSRGSSWPRIQTCISCIGRWILYHWITREVLILLAMIFTERSFKL